MSYRFLLTNKLATPSDRASIIEIACKEYYRKASRFRDDIFKNLTVYGKQAIASEIARKYIISEKFMFEILDIK